MKSIQVTWSLWRGQADRLLGRWSPVFFVVAMLAVLSAATLLAGALSWISATPTELLLSFAAAVVGTLVGAFLGAAITRLWSGTAAWPKADSTLLTAFLVFLLMLPGDTAQVLGGTALTGIIAGASKYLIAIRGRHIFNPAAFGAAVAGLTGLADSVWWVASEPMLWWIVGLGLLVLLRTQLLPEALLAAGLAIVGTGSAMLVIGMPASWALTLPFTSFPFLFLAAFMLSEPLTLPPRRGQRLLIAFIVGVLLAVPVMLAAIGMPFPIPPEVALLVGNLVAWFLGARRAIALEVVGLSQVGELRELVLRPAKPLRFLPGQAIELSADHRRSDLRGQRRVFSIASAAGDGELSVVFGVPASRVSTAKRSLAALEPGDQILATRVFGDFVLPDDWDRKALLVAGGVGITPFLSMIRTNALGDAPRDLVLVYRTSDPAAPYLAELQATPGVRVVPFLERRPDAESLAEAVPDLRERIAYVSGPPAMVGALSAMLRRAGVRRVRRDAFSGA